MSGKRRWQQAAAGYQSRRALIRTGITGAVGLSAVTLLACGGGDSGSSAGGQGGGTGGSIGSALNTTSTPAGTAKRGGVWRTTLPTDPPTLDPYNAITANTKTAAAYVYSRLFMSKAEPGAGRTFDVVPDVAASIESPDPLTHTIKLKPNVKFHAPLDRTLTAQDVVFSVDRFAGRVSGFAGAQEKSQLDFIDSVTAIDDTTVRFRLKRPNGWFLNILANPDLLFIMPRETGTAFDPAQKMVGSGPWIFEQFQPGRSVSFRRNPAWHFGPDRPYLDRAEISIVPEYATRLNQFFGGNLDEIDVNGEDVKRTLDTVKGVQFDVRASTGLQYVYFSGTEPQAPWKDPRVRQAVSMAIDRDALLDAAFNYDKLIAQGVDLKRVWNNAVPAGYADYWLDPKSPDVAQYYRYDVEGAKKLLAEAGYARGFSAPFRYSPSRYGTAYKISAELIQQMMDKISIKLDLVEEDYNSVFIVKTFVGEFTGWAYQGHGQPDPLGYLTSMYPSDAKRNHSKINDPKIDASVADIVAESDTAKRKQKVLDIQRYISQNMLYPFTPSGAAFSAFQPNVRGIKDYQVYYFGRPTEVLANIWKDA